MLRCFILLLYAYASIGIGYDAGGGDRTSCGRPYRAGRLYQPPCDLERMGYCSQAGQLYPWRAVKRFVKDNQGLMRRMYGDQRHGHALKAELDDLDFEEEWEKRERESGGYGRWRPETTRYARYEHHYDIDNDLDEDLDLEDETPNFGQPRYLRGDLTNEDVLNTKFVISEQEAAIAIKLAELKAAAHFRPVTQRSPITSQKTRLSPYKNKETSYSTAKTTTTTRKPSTTELKQTTTSSAESTTIKTSGSEENLTESSKASTKYSSIDTAEEITITSTPTTTTDSITETTTERIQSTTKKPSIYYNELSEKPTSTKSSTERASANDDLGATDDLEKLIHKGESGTKISNENLKNSEQFSDDHFDQTVESSENSEIYSDSDGIVDEDSIDRPSAVLFQDMEEQATKKKGAVDYNKMKGVNACPVKEEVVAPFWANNTRGEVLALLNMYPFEQYVHWEKCTFEHRQMYCREGCRCEQQYRLHRLLAYDPNNECRGIFSDWFRFPSCCVCKCYDMPPEFRVTSRSPRFQVSFSENDQDYDN